jgi:hypothetical protein
MTTIRRNEKKSRRPHHPSQNVQFHRRNQIGLGRQENKRADDRGPGEQQPNLNKSQEFGFYFDLSGLILVGFQHRYDVMAL